MNFLVASSVYKRNLCLRNVKLNAEVLLVNVDGVLFFLEIAVVLARIVLARVELHGICCFIIAS